MRLAFGLLLFASLAIAQHRTSVLLDTDLGDAIDDAFALAFAVNSPEIDLRAVTTVAGDTEQKARLAWKMLSIYNRRSVTLGIGATEPLLGQPRPGNSREYEILTGSDPLPTAGRAAQVIVNELHQQPLTIVAIGPLTNIALALKLDPSIKPRIERIVLMGGAYGSPEAEYNIAWDPTAAEIVFRSGVPITALGLEVTKPLVFRDVDLVNLREKVNPASLFLQQLLLLEGNEHPTLFDPLALAVLVQPELVSLREGAVTVAPESGVTTFSPADRATTLVGTAVQSDRSLNLISERLVVR